MKLVLLLMIMALTLACGKKSEPNTPGASTNDSLKQRYDTYLKLSTAYQDDLGWPYTGCDSIGYSAIYALATGQDVKIRAAEEEPGKWLRRPLQYGNCYPLESKSEMSRDHIIKVMMWMVRAQDSSGLIDLYEYVKGHTWMLGNGLLSRTLVTPQLLATLLQSIYHLGGPDNDGRHLPYWPGGQDYAAETAAIHILVRIEVDGVYSRYISWLEDMVRREPHNPLFHMVLHRITDGCQETATALLLDESQWPKGRLPTSKEHCSAWVFERSAGTDWQPCPEENKTHPAGEWLFVAGEIL